MLLSDFLKKIPSPKTFKSADETPVPPRPANPPAAEGPCDPIVLLAAEEERLEKLRKDYGPIRQAEQDHLRTAKANPALASLGQDPQRDVHDVETLLAGGAIGKNVPPIDPGRAGRAFRTALERQQRIVADLRSRVGREAYVIDGWEKKHRPAILKIARALIALRNAADEEFALAVQIQQAGAFPNSMGFSGLKNPVSIRLRTFLRSAFASMNSHGL